MISASIGRNGHRSTWYPFDLASRRRAARARRHADRVPGYSSARSAGESILGRIVIRKTWSIRDPMENGPVIVRRRRRARGGFGMEWARLRGIDLHAKRTAPMALDERSNIFGCLESGETHRSGFSGRRRPGQTYVRDHRHSLHVPSGRVSYFVP